MWCMFVRVKLVIRVAVGSVWPTTYSLIVVCHFCMFDILTFLKKKIHHIILTFLTFGHVDTWTFVKNRRAGVLRALLARGGCPQRPRLFRRTCGCGKLGNML